MTMKRILLIALALLTLAVPLSAQTYMTATTLASAVTTTSQTSWTVASASTVAVGGRLFVDNEVVSIVAVNGTTVTVARFGKPQTHANGAAVLVVPVAAVSTATVPHSGRPAAGTCNPAAYAYLPIIDVDTGDAYLCRYIAAAATARVWAATNVFSLNGATSRLWTLQ